MISLVPLARNKEARKGLFSYALAWFGGQEIPGLQGLVVGQSNGMDSSLLIRHQRARLEASTNQSKRNEESTMKIMRIGIDLAKTVFQIHGVDAHEHPVCRRQLRRHQLLEFFQKLEPCLIGMEACAGAHHWARQLQAMGHTVKLIAPQFVKAYVRGNKNDANDAEAICEAVSRPGMRFVPIKTIEQQDLQALHRIRTELIHQRTAKVNQIRGLLAEYGIVIAVTVKQLRKALPLILEDAENGLSARFRHLLDGLRADLVYLDEQIAIVDQDMVR
jgi:transposase